MARKLTKAQTGTLGAIAKRMERHHADEVFNSWRVPTVECLERAGFVTIRKEHGRERLWSDNRKADYRYWTARYVKLTEAGRKLAATL